MADEYPNIFNALFKYHPRDRHTPWENFLTEAIAYILKTEPCAAEVWLSLMIGRNVKLDKVDVLTQNSERAENEASTVFPDLKVIASLKGGGQQIVYCEHKWDSSCDDEQLRKYAKLAKRDQGNSIVTFVGANQMQVREARKLQPEFVQKAVCWEDIYRSFEEISNPSLMLKELLVFMATQDLSPGAPLNAAGLRAIINAPAVMKQLKRYADKLFTFDWSFLKERYRKDNAPTFPCVVDRWGQIGIEFITKGWAPAIAVGFLYDPLDHRVTLIRSEDGIDLVLRISTDPRKNTDQDPNTIQILHALRSGRERIYQREKSQKHRTRVLLRGERGNGNKWTLLIAQKCLADVIENCDSETKQLEVIYDCFLQWLTALFDDPNLEMALKELKHFPGPINTSKNC